MPNKQSVASDELSRRERQIMDILISGEEVTAAAIRTRMAGDPSYSAVRAVLRVLVEKGLVSHRYDGPRYIYKSMVSKQLAKKTTLKKVLDTFFEGSREQLVATLLDLDDDEASPKELKRLARLIEKAREQAR